MTSLEGTLSNARARVASLRFWGNTFVDNYDAYAADHASCPGFVSVRSDVVAARDDVRAFARTVEERLDDSGWVTEIGDRAQQWNRARSHVSDASAAVAEDALRATTTWRRGASGEYRGAIPAQRTALTAAHEACGALKQGCSDLETAGTTHFESVESLAATLSHALPYHVVGPAPLFSYGSGGSGYLTPPIAPAPTYGPENPAQPQGPTVPCMVGTLHYGATQLQADVRTPLETARTALTTADDALRLGVRDAMSEPVSRHGGPQPDGNGSVAYVAEQLGGPWPVPGQVTAPSGGPGPV